MKRTLILLALMLAAACAPSAADAPIAEQWRSVAVEAAPVQLGVERVGQLRFRGGLQLRADEGMFGGFSGLEVMDDGRVFAITDNGDWFEAQLVLDEGGALIGLRDARMAMMRDERGVPFGSKEEGDSEGLAQLPDGRFAVSFEQSQSIRIYDLNRDGPFGAAAPGPRLEGVRRLPANVGLEALAATESGALLVGAEGGGASTSLWLAPIGAVELAPVRATYPLGLGFSLTSLDRLPDGGFVALERFYAPIVGARARIAVFSEAELANERVRKQVLAELAPPMLVDNFEGVAATRMADGVTRIYILSDNNFSTRQRTLLYAFDVVPDAPN